MSDIGFVIKEKIASLEAALLANNPNMPVLLREIHTVLKADASNVTLLSDAEIGVVVNGLKRQTATEIAVSSIKKGTGKTKSAPVSVDDI